MTTVLIMGASSGIGLATTSLALQRGHAVVAFARSANSIQLQHDKLRKVAGDARDSSDVRRAIGYVAQDTFLADTSVAQNIAYGMPDATREAVIEAAKSAEAHDFIVALPQGYDTPVGERGLRLSGGQRQRLALARAILKDPPILVLDEATSALDSANERAIANPIPRLPPVTKAVR